MRLIAFAFAVIIAFASYGSQSADSVKVAFHLGQSEFDPSLDDNGEAMESFIKAVQKADAENSIDSIVIRAYTSPDGTTRINELLSSQRCDVIADLIARRASVNPSLIHTIPEGIAWDELRRLVAETPHVPDRQKILDILDNTPVLVFDSRGKIINGRKKQLMDLNGGRTYKWLFANLFPLMRNAIAVALFTKQDKVTQNSEVIPEPAPEETAEERAIGTTVADNPEPPTLTDTIISQRREKTDSRFALKTNLLFYALLMPNLEIEWKCAERWSVALEGQMAWWDKESIHKVYRVATLIPEARYWVIERSRWHGMYVGLFGGIGLYDLDRANGKKGHEGEGFMAGASVGYMWPISKHLSLDAGIGVGYLRARDKAYLPLDGHFLYQLTKNINYFGPLRLKLSLVWRIPR